MADVKLTTLYCDDIRQEITGKLIYVGVYQGEMHLGAMPYEFNNFHAVMFFYLPLGDKFQSLSLEVLLDDEVIFNADIDPSDLPSDNAEFIAESKKNNMNHHRMNVIAMINKITFTDSSIISSKAIVDGTVVPGDNLVVKSKG